MAFYESFLWMKYMRANSKLVEDSRNSVLAQAARLTAVAAINDGVIDYCGHKNPVKKGQYAAGATGIKKILGLKSNFAVKPALEKLEEFDLIHFSYYAKTYTITVRNYLGLIEPNKNGETKCRPPRDKGFVFLSRNMAEALVAKGYRFDDTDALIDLYVHTVYGEEDNIFSMMCPCVRFNNEVALSLSALAERWKWSKAKVCRLFKAHPDLFALRRLPGTYGCVVFSLTCPDVKDLTVPTEENVIDVFHDILNAGCNKEKPKDKRAYFNGLIFNYSRSFGIDIVDANPEAMSAQNNDDNDDDDDDNDTPEGGCLDSSCNDTAEDVDMSSDTASDGDNAVPDGKSDDHFAAINPITHKIKGKKGKIIELAGNYASVLKTIVSDPYYFENFKHNRRKREYSYSSFYKDAFLRECVYLRFTFPKLKIPVVWDKDDAISVKRRCCIDISV